MSVTAARLGSAPITVDWSNLGRIPLGDVETQKMSQSWATLKARFDSREIGFYHAPKDDTYSQANATAELAQKILSRDTFSDVLFLGIGGSSLGPMSLLKALKSEIKTSLRFHFQENPDPTDWRLTLSKLNPQNTLVVCVTKSGNTFETIAQFLIALEWLGKSKWSSHVVAITDPEKGDLRTFAKAHEIPNLSIAPSIGGRFSVFTPVGLFVAALAGLSIKEFLLGASLVRDYVEKAPVEKNPLFILGAEFIRQSSKRPIHVIMPYSTPLRETADWFVQLWAESLGKDLKGFTPIAALGATDQHSILQLLRDGPDDKITFFFTVDQVTDAVQIPRFKNSEMRGLSSFTQLEGHSLNDLLLIEYRATALVMTKRTRPHLTFQIDRLNEKNCGALFFALSIMTAFTGTYWGINPFDQPGVEEGKIYIRQALGEVQTKRFENDRDEENSAYARLRLRTQNYSDDDDSSSTH